jgi:multidrug efflux system membrane fusion protein
VPVTVATARTGDLDVFLTALGTVTPLSTVTVRSRVDGQLLTAAFSEGQRVRRGDPLFQIDPRPFQVQLAQAEGQLAKDQASLENATLDLDRYRVLVEQDSIARQQLDTQAALVHQFEGALASDRAQIDSARLNLTYSHIDAPTGGRIGLRLVDPGNIVHASDQTGLVVIAQVQPIAAVFAIAQDSLPAVLSRVRAGPHPEVEAYDRELTHKLATGALLAVDNEIDPTTGTVKLKATFANRDDALFPSQFVNVKLLVDTLRAAVLVPVAAIQRSSQATAGDAPRGAGSSQGAAESPAATPDSAAPNPESRTFVYVVKPDATVDVRNVTVRVTQGDEAAIASGLAAGEIVVVDGVDKLQPGGKVLVRRE